MLQKHSTGGAQVGRQWGWGSSGKSLLCHYMCVYTRVGDEETGAQITVPATHTSRNSRNRQDEALQATVGSSVTLVLSQDVEGGASCQTVAQLPCAAQTSGLGSSPLLSPKLQVLLGSKPGPLGAGNSGPIVHCEFFCFSVGRQRDDNRVKIAYSLGFCCSAPISVFLTLFHFIFSEMRSQKHRQETERGISTQSFLQRSW